MVLLLIRIGLRLGLLLIGLVLFGCNSTRFLQEDEYLLTDNEVKIRGKVRNKSDLDYELLISAKQQPNNNFLFIPREWFYLTSIQPNDTTGWDRFKRRRLGEPPVIYNDSLTRASVEDMQYLLQYKGYFNASVFADDETRGQKVSVTYYATPGAQFLIDSVTFSSEDPRIDSLLQDARENTLLKRGRGLDLSLYAQEKERLTQYLRNNGYAFFYPSYLDKLEVDTTQRSKHANLYIQVLPPPSDSAHTVYRVGEVNVYPNYDPLDDARLRDTIIGPYRFFFRNQRPLVKPQAIARNIFLQPGETYRQDDYRKTNLQLSALGIYRFVRIRQEVDSLQPGVLNFAIQMTPSYRMEAGVDFDINYNNRSGSAGTGNLIGFSLSPTFRNRNLFRGAELLVTNLSAGVEVNPNVNDSRFWNTVDLRAQAELLLPRFRDYAGLYRFLHRLPLGRDRHLLNEGFYTALRENTATRISLSYEYLDIIDWYRYNLFNARYGYDFQKSKSTRYLINHLGIDYLQPRTDSLFESVLANNPFLARSFGQQVFVSLLFREIDYVRTGRVNRRGESIYLNGRFEVAGAEIYALNGIYNAFARENTVFRLDDTTSFSQYALLETDFRYYRQFTPRRGIAMRFNFGLARPYGNTADVPYVKQFYVGGPSSIRAWAPRGLGPGGYQDTLLTGDPENNLRLYQTGSLKLEYNIEYRFDLFWRVKGAFFLDAGNVWTIERDPDRCGSQFLFSRQTYECGGQPFTHMPFYRQIAVGGGFGMRVDLTYFIFRLDLGVKLRNNFPQNRREGPIRESDYWNDFSGFGIRDIAFNIGLGYPF